MGVLISAVTLQGKNLNSEYRCFIERDAEKLGIEVDRVYLSNDCNEYLSISYQSYSNLKRYLDFLGSEIGIVGFEHHFFSSEGVITHNECEELLTAFDKNVDKTEAITWKEFAFSYYSTYDDNEEFIDGLEHMAMRSYQSEQALMNRRFRVLIKIVRFAVKQNGFIVYG
ncbi:hypothetical protein [Aliivibrio salmonicida]|uniref:hypothetical protein n=1 Tax=Aliivibrio salmonicida TaxID=40269 RepID=UPI003D0F05D7